MESTGSHKLRFSLRSLLILTAMAGLIAGWWRLFGLRCFPAWPGYWSWQGWLTIGTIAIPFFVPLAGNALQANWHAGYFVKLWVMLAGANVIWGFYAYLNAINADNWRVIVELVYEEFRVQFWSAFVLPVTLAIFASASVARQESRPTVWDYALIAVVVGNVVLLYRLVPIVLGMAGAK